MSDVYQFDEGVEFRVDTEIDLTGYTAVRLFVQTSTGIIEWTPVTVTTGQTEYNETSGLTIIKYISKAGDLNFIDPYVVIAYAEFGPGSKHSGKPDVFIVFEKFKPV